MGTLLGVLILQVAYLFGLTLAGLLCCAPSNIAPPTSAVAIATVAAFAEVKASSASRRWTLPPLHDLFV